MHWKSDPTPQDPAAVPLPSNFSLSDFRAIINRKPLVTLCESVCVRARAPRLPHPGGPNPLRKIDRFTWRVTFLTNSLLNAPFALSSLHRPLPSRLQRASRYHSSAAGPSLCPEAVPIRASLAAPTMLVTAVQERVAWDQQRSPG